MAERVHLFTTPNLLDATPNSLHATPNLFHATLNTIIIIILCSFYAMLIQVRCLELQKRIPKERNTLNN